MNSHIISMREKQRCRADRCKLARLLTGDQSIIAAQVHNPSVVTHRTSRPAREQSFSPFCHFLSSSDEPIFLPPSNWCLSHTPDGSEERLPCQAHSFWLSANPKPIKQTVASLHQLGGGLVAQWLVVLVLVLVVLVVLGRKSPLVSYCCLKYSKINNGTKSKTKTEFILIFINKVAGWPFPSPSSLCDPLLDLL